MAPPITASLWVGSILWQCSLIKEPVWPLQRGYLSSALSSPLSLFAHRTLIDAFKGPGNVDSVASSMSPGKRERTRLFAGAHNPIPAAPVFSSPGRFVGHRFMFLNHCYQSRRACDREIEKRLIGSWREEGPTTKPTSELCNAPTKKLPYDHGGIFVFQRIYAGAAIARLLVISTIPGAINATCFRKRIMALVYPVIRGLDSFGDDIPFTFEWHVSVFDRSADDPDPQSLRRFLLWVAPIPHRAKPRRRLVSPPRPVDTKKHGESLSDSRCECCCFCMFGSAFGVISSS